MRPAITAAATIVFLFSFTSFGVIRILGAPGTRTIEVEVWRRATQLGDVGGATVLALLQLTLLAVVLTWSTIVQRTHSRALALRPVAPRRRARTRGERSFVAVAAGATSLVALVPLTALVVRSFSTPDGWSTNAWTNLGRTEVRPGLRVGIDPVDAIANSLVNAMWATLFAVVVGGLASLAITAARRHGRLIDGGLMLPLATSAVTIGLGMLITFDVAPVDWRASWWLVPVGHALVAVPFVVRICVGVLRSVGSGDDRCGRHPRSPTREGMASDRGALPVAPARRRRRPRGGDLTRRVRRDQLPVAFGWRDPPDRHRATAGPHGHARCRRRGTCSPPCSRQ